MTSFCSLSFRPFGSVLSVPYLPLLSFFYLHLSVLFRSFHPLLPFFPFYLSVVSVSSTDSLRSRLYAAVFPFLLSLLYFLSFAFRSLLHVLWFTPRVLFRHILYPSITFGPSRSCSLRPVLYVPFFTFCCLRFVLYFSCVTSCSLHPFHYLPFFFFFLNSIR